MPLSPGWQIEAGSSPPLHPEVLLGHVERPLGQLAAVLDISLLRSPTPKSSQNLAMNLVTSAARRVESSETVRAGSVSRRGEHGARAWIHATIARPGGRGQTNPRWGHGLEGCENPSPKKNGPFHCSERLPGGRKVDPRATAARCAGVDSRHHRAARR